MLYPFAFESGMRPGQMRALTVSSFDLESTPATVTSFARHVKRRRRHVQQVRPELAALLADEFANRFPAAAAFRMPDETNLARMFRADLADTRQEWIDAASTPTQRATRTTSDFLSAKNHQDEVACFYSIRHGHGTALGLAGVAESVYRRLHAPHQPVNDTALHPHHPQRTHVRLGHVAELR